MNKYIDFQELVCELKHLRRTGWVLRGIVKAETVASHSWRMALMAIKKEKELKNMKVDVKHVIRMCLLHDIGEVIIGDIIPEEHQGECINISNQEKKKRELAVINDLAIKFDFYELKNVFEEYEEQKTLEAIVVKNLDKLDMLLQAYEYILEYNNSALNEFMEYNEKAITLDVFKEDLEEIKRRQFKGEIKKNNFIDFNMLAGKLKHLERSGPKMYGVIDCETVASHCYRSALMAICFEDKLKENKVDIDEVIKMLIVHDIAETIIGDIVPEKWQKGNKISNEEKQKKEVNALMLIADEYDFNYANEVYDKIKSRKTIEASIAKDIEIFECIQQAYEYIKKYPHKEILREYVNFHRPRIVNKFILSLVNEIELRQNEFLKSKNLI